MDAPRPIIGSTRQAARATATPAPAKSGVPPLGLMPERVLIADDSLAMLDIIATVLQSLGVVNAYPVNTGSAAINFLYHSPQPVDVVMADLDMPHGTGLNLLQTIRSGAIRNVRPDMCVILFSGLWTTETLTLSRQLDVNGVLAKPFSPGKLRDEIMAARRRVFPLDFNRYRCVSLAN